MGSVTTRVYTGTLRCQYCGLPAPRAHTHARCTAPDCVRAYDRDRYRREHVPRASQSDVLDLRNVDERFKARFWTKVDVRGPDECWPWTAGRSKKGYGLFVVQRGRMTTASRVAFALANGIIERGLTACHKCDNPPCCNPGDLFKGTGSDNQIDSVTKGRKNSPHGEAHRSARLTEEKVREIRALHALGRNINSLAREYGVSWEAIKAVVTGKTWRHVQ